LHISILYQLICLQIFFDVGFVGLAEDSWVSRGDRCVHWEEEEEEKQGNWLKEKITN
jgi:hypothetical protein